MKNKILIRIILSIFLCGALVFYIKIKPSWDIEYNIINYAGLQDTSNGLGLSYAQTFEIRGKLVFKNYKNGTYIIRAYAIGNNNAKIRIFTLIKIEGDGEYNFVMDSFYKYNVKKIVEVTNFEIKEE